MRDVQVEVIKRSLAVFVLGWQQVKQPVGIRGSAAEDKRGLILDQRSFHIEPGGQQANPRRAGDVLFIPFAAADVDHG